MHKPALAPLVYARLFPSPKPTDPSSFHAYTTKNLVPEVRAETARFYGHLDCIEAQYPGLDYAVAAHRLRLGRFPYHRRLFQIFDDLRLTNHEIQTLCKWEGTRWARERYEKDIGVKVRDTTWDDVAPVVAHPPTITRSELRGGENLTSADQHVSGDELTLGMECERIEGLVALPMNDQEHNDERGMDEKNEEPVMEEDNEDGRDLPQEEGEVSEEESEDELQLSVGVELNQRLMAATEARNRGEEAVLDADWEQWLKEAAERGVTPEVPRLPSLSTSQLLTGEPSPWDAQVEGILNTGAIPRVDISRPRLIPPDSLPLPGTTDSASASAGTAM